MQCVSQAKLCPEAEAHLICSSNTMIAQLHTSSIDQTLGECGQWLKAFDKAPVHDTCPPRLARTCGLRRTFWSSSITRLSLLGRCRRLHYRQYMLGSCRCIPQTEALANGIRQAANLGGWCFASVTYSHEVLKDILDSLKVLGDAVAGS